MAHDLFSFDSSVLLVRDVAGDYRPAEAGEVLQAAQRLLGRQLQGRDVLSSLQAVRDFLRVKLGAIEHEVFGVLHTAFPCVLPSTPQMPIRWLGPMRRYRSSLSHCSTTLELHHPGSSAGTLLQR